MESSPKNNLSDHTLLMVISSKMDTIIEDIREVKEEMKTKVHFSDFQELKRIVEEHKKETREKIESHTIKLTVGSTLVMAASWLASHFLK